MVSRGTWFPEPLVTASNVFSRGYRSGGEILHDFRDFWGWALNSDKLETCLHGLEQLIVVPSLTEAGEPPSTGAPCRRDRRMQCASRRGRRRGYERCRRGHER